MPEQRHKHPPRINSAPGQYLYIQYRVFSESMSHRTSAVQKLAQRPRNQVNPKTTPAQRQCCNDVEDAVPTLQQHWTKAPSSPESDTCDTIARLTAIVSHAQYKSTNRTHLCRTAYL